MPSFHCPLVLYCAIVLTSVALADSATAGIVQWRVRVPEGADNPQNIGSYTNTIETGNGGSTGYDAGLDVDLDTSIVPNGKFFVSYIDQAPHKVEYEFTDDLMLGESYTAHLSFENNTLAGSAFVANTVEFLAADANYSYQLAVDSNDNGSYDTFRSGVVADLLVGNGEIVPWFQVLFPSNDHRFGWYYGELTITRVSEPTSSALAWAAVVLSAALRLGVKPFYSWFRLPS